MGQSSMVGKGGGVTYHFTSYAGNSDDRWNNAHYIQMLKTGNIQMLKTRNVNYRMRRRMKKHLATLLSVAVLTACISMPSWSDDQSDNRFRFKKPKFGLLSLFCEIVAPGTCPSHDPPEENLGRRFGPQKVEDLDEDPELDEKAAVDHLSANNGVEPSLGSDSDYTFAGGNPNAEVRDSSEAVRGEFRLEDLGDNYLLEEYVDAIYQSLDPPDE